MQLALYDDLSIKDQTRFRRALQHLVYAGSLQSILPQDKEDFQILRQYYSVASDWLSLADVHLEVDDDYGILQIVPVGEEELGSDVLRRRDEIALLAVLRTALEEERARNQVGFHRLTVREIRNRFESRMGGIRLAAKRLSETLPRFRRMKLVDYRGAADEADTSVLVLPLMLKVTPENIETMITQVQKGIENEEDADGAQDN